MISLLKKRPDLWPAAIVIGIASLFITPFISGWTLQVMWGWFVVPLGVRPIGIAQAYGLIAMTGLIKFGLAMDKSEQAEESGALTRVAVAVAQIFVLNGSILLVGAIAHWFMQ